MPKSTILRFFFVGAAISALAVACAPMGEGPIFGPSGGALPGLDRNSAIRSALSNEDREGMSRAALQLLQSGQTNATQGWQTRSGDSGTVRIGSPVLVGLDSLSGAPIPAPADIDTTTPLSEATGNYAAKQTVNVRLAPSTQAPVAQTLSPGTIVRAYAKAAEWLLVGNSDAVYGYASSTLFEARGGGEPVLAGGRARRPRLCRDVSLQVSLANGQRDLWSSLVCKTDGGGWEVPPERGLS